MNRLAVSLQQSIHTLHARGWSARRIARELGLHRETVGRELRLSKPAKVATGSAAEAEAKPAKVATGSRSLCEPHREIITAALVQGLSAIRIHQDLVADHAFSGRYNTVKRFVQVGIAVFFGFVWTDSISPSFYQSGLQAIEYAVVALLMRVISGMGRATYDELHNKGILPALSITASVLFFLVLGFLLLSISLKPGFPLYLLSVKRVRGACIVLLCSALYGFLAQRSDARLPTK